MAIWDTLSVGGIPITDIVVIAVILAIIVVVAWYLKHRKDKSVASSDTHYKNEKRGKRYLRDLWKKFLSSKIWQKKITKAEESVEETEEEIKIHEEREIDQVKNLIQLIDQYKSSPDPKLLSGIKIRAKQMLKDFGSLLGEADNWVTQVYRLPGNYEKWKRLIRRENRNVRMDLANIETQEKLAITENDIYGKRKLENLAKQKKYITLLANSSLAILSEINGIEERYKQAAQEMNEFFQEGTKLKAQILANRNLFKLRDLAQQTLNQIERLDQLILSHQSLQGQKLKASDTQIDHLQDQRRQFFADLKAEEQNFQQIIEDQKIAESIKKQQEQAAAEVT